MQILYNDHIINFKSIHPAILKLFSLKDFGKTKRIKAPVKLAAEVRLLIKFLQTIHSLMPLKTTSSQTCAVIPYTVVLCNFGRSDDKIQTKLLTRQY